MNRAPAPSCSALRRLPAITLALVVVALVCWPLAALADQPDAPVRGYSFKGTQEFVVLYDESVALGPRLQSERRRGNEVKDRFWSAINGALIELDASDANRLGKDDRVLAIEPNREVSTLSNAPLDRPVTSWGLDWIDSRDGALDGHLITSSRGFGVEAFVIDTGIRLDHQEFSGRINDEGFSSFPGGPNDCDGHGTHVAGTLAGSTFGVAPGARLTAVRVLDCEGRGTIASVLAGIDWMINKHQSGEPAVANMSLGGGRSHAMNQAVLRAFDDGITVVVSAGNDYPIGEACWKSPASEPAAITVGATTAGGLAANFSNQRECVDLFAPGRSIQSAWHTSSDATYVASGTSMAAPHVAGAAALILSSQPGANPEEVTARLISGSTPGIPGFIEPSFSGEPMTTVQSCTPSRILYAGTQPDVSPPPTPGPGRPGAPSNDDFSNRQLLTSLSGTNGSTVCATGEVGEPSHRYFSPNPPWHTIWYRWTAPSNGRLNLCATGPDAGSSENYDLAVYRGESVRSLVRLAKAQGLRRCPAVSVRVRAGASYSIALDTFIWEGSTRIWGDFQPAPSNDEFSSAEPLALSGTTGSTASATAEPGEMGHDPADPQSRTSIWFRWTAPSNGSLDLSTSTSFKHKMAVYSGNTLSSAVNVATGDSAGFTSSEIRGLRVERGVTYRLAVDSFGPSDDPLRGDNSGWTYVRGSFAPFPSNDDFRDAAPLDLSGVRGSNQNATSEPGEPSHTESTDGNGSNWGPRSSTWYRWTAPADGALLLDSSDSRSDQLAVYTGQTVGSLTRVAMGRPGNCCPLKTRVRFPVQAGTTYSVAIDGSREGDTLLKGSFSQKPSNDDFAEAAPLVLSGMDVTNAGASHEPGERAHTKSLHHRSDEARYSVWYRWVAPRNGSLIVRSSDAASSHDLALYRGESVSSLEALGHAGASLANTISIAVTRDATYFLAFDSYHEFDSVEAKLAGRFTPSPLARPKITGGPRGSVITRSASFVFSAKDASAYSCKLDRGPWRTCGSPRRYRGLKPGRHTFRVRQVSGDLISPVESRTWKIVKKKGRKKSTPCVERCRDLRSVAPSTVRMDLERREND